MAPDHNQQIHGNQHEFPKKEEQKQIDRQKHPNHTAQSQQDITVKQSNAALDFSPGGHRRDNAHDGRQDDQNEAKPIKPQMQADPPMGNPAHTTFYEPCHMTRGLNGVISGPEEQREETVDR